MDLHLPPPQTVNDFYAAAMLGAINEIGATLDELRDRLLAPTAGEPVTALEPEPEPEPIAVQEPAPARKPRSTPARKATTRKAGR